MSAKESIIRLDYLNEQWDAVEGADNSPVMTLACQDVQSANCTLHNLLHPHTIDKCSLAWVCCPWSRTLDKEQQHGAVQPIKDNSEM